MRIAGLILLGGFAILQQQATFKPVATNAQLMTAIIVPSSDALFDVSIEAPKTDEDWAALESHALILAESGNLLMMPGRAPADDWWLDESRELVDASEIALKAVQAKDVSGVLKAGDRILGTCERCHYEFEK